MPVMASPEMAKKCDEKWMLPHREAVENADGAGSFDDSLTSLHWLQNFSIVSAGPDRAPGFAWRPQQFLHPLGSTESPSSPPAGDTAATGTAHTPGNPAASCSKLAGSIYSPLTGPQAPQEVDYKNNPHVKPPHSYATLICMAMQASKKTKITLSAIYSWITENFCYYRHAEPSWQNSIRHNLSLNKCFMKVPRQKNEPGKGGFWQIDPQYADMFVNGVFKRRRMPATTFTTQRQNRLQSSCNSCTPLDNQQTSTGHLSEPVLSRKRKRGGKQEKTSQSPLLASEMQTSDILRGDFDLASVFDDVLSENGSTFEDLDINTALSSLGCEIEVPSQNQHSNVTKWYNTEDEQACAYLEMNSMMGCSVEDIQQQEQYQSHLQYYEGMALFSDLHQHQQQQPWENKEMQSISLSLDQGYNLCDGFFSEMPMWERGEAFF